jgi:2-keto-4-pentenoate hydratase
VQAEQVLKGLADEPWQAEQTGVPVEPLTKRHADLEVEDAYAISH